MTLCKVVDYNGSLFTIVNNEAELIFGGIDNIREKGTKKRNALGEIMTLDMREDFVFSTRGIRYEYGYIAGESMALMVVIMFFRTC